MRLRERGVSLTKVARTLGKDPSTVSRVNQRQRRSREIEEAIAERLGLSVRDAFPEWHRRRSDQRRTKPRHDSMIAKVQGG